MITKRWINEKAWNWYDQQEWLARTRDNHFRPDLSYYKKYNVSCYAWGFVNGKLRTHLPWSTAQTSINEAVEDEDTDTWFHDLLHGDSTPYRREEIEMLTEYTGWGNPAVVPEASDD